MRWLVLIAVYLCVSCLSWLPAAAEEVAPPCFKIPSSEDISASEGISTYREQYSPQRYEPESNRWIWVDLGMLAAVLLVGGVMVWRHVHYSRFWILGALSLLYFGMVRGGCICPVGSVANISIGLRHPEMVGASTAVMFLLPLVVALLMGRVFCSAGCPLGAVQHMLGGGRQLTVPALVLAIMRGLPVVVLAATAWLAVRGTCLLVCLLDPYKTLFFFGYGWIQRLAHLVNGGLVEPGVLWIGDLASWGVLAAAVGLGVWVYRPFCRFVCPYGVLLGLLSVVAVKRRQIDQSQCVQCALCQKKCPVGAIVRDPQTREFTISSYHCIQCNRCSSMCRKNGIY